MFAYMSFDKKKFIFKNSRDSSIVCQFIEKRNEVTQTVYNQCDLLSFPRYVVKQDMLSQPSTPPGYLLPFFPFCVSISLLATCIPMSLSFICGFLHHYLHTLCCLHANTCTAMTVVPSKLLVSGVNVKTAATGKKCFAF